MKLNHSNIRNVGRFNLFAPKFMNKKTKSVSNGAVLFFISITVVALMSGCAPKKDTYTTLMIKSNVASDFSDIQEQFKKIPGSETTISKKITDDDVKKADEMLTSIDNKLKTIKVEEIKSITIHSNLLSCVKTAHEEIVLTKKIQANITSLQDFEKDVLKKKVDFEDLVISMQNDSDLNATKSKKFVDKAFVKYRDTSGFIERYATYYESLNKIGLNSSPATIYTYQAQSESLLKILNNAKADTVQGKKVWIYYINIVNKSDDIMNVTLQVLELANELVSYQKEYFQNLDNIKQSYEKWIKSLDDTNLNLKISSGSGVKA